MTWAIDLKCNLGSASDLVVKFPIAQLSFLTGAVTAKTLLAKEVLVKESSRLTESLSQIRSNQWQAALTEQNSRIQELEHLAPISYIDWSLQKNQSLNLLSALDLELDFYKLVRDQAKLACPFCSKRQVSDQSTFETQINKLFQGKNCQISVSAPSNNRIEWIKQISSLGYEQFRLNNRTMRLTELDLVAPHIKESDPLFVIIDTLKPESDALRLQNAVLISLKLGNQKFCCSALNSEDTNNHQAYFGRGHICSSCGHTILDWKDRNNLKDLKALRFELNNLSIAELSSIPIETILNKKLLEATFQTTLQKKLENFNELKLLQLPLLAESSADQSKLNLVKILAQLKPSDYLIIDHASLGLADQDFAPFAKTLASISQTCQGILVIDQNTHWKSLIAYQATLTKDSIDYCLQKQANANKKMISEPIKLSPEILKRLLNSPKNYSFILSGLSDFSSLSEQIKQSAELLFPELRVTMIERSLSEPNKQTLYSYFGIEKIFTAYLLKTSEARIAGLTGKSFQKLPPIEQERFTFKNHSIFSLQAESINNLALLFSALPDLNKILSYINFAKLGHYTLGTSCEALSRSELDRIKLIKKLLILPKSCQLALIQEPLVALDSGLIETFYTNLFDKLNCACLLFISNQDLRPSSSELFYL
jgi:hypothetical protein